MTQPISDERLRELDPEAMKIAQQALFDCYNRAIDSGKKLGSGVDMAEAAVRAYLAALRAHTGAREGWDICIEFNNRDGFVGLRRWTRDKAQAEDWQSQPDAGRFEFYRSLIPPEEPRVTDEEMKEP